MAETLVIRVSDLLPEFFAHALILLRPLQAAGAVTAGTLQALPDQLDHLCILIQPYSHIDTSFLVLE